MLLSTTVILIAGSAVSTDWVLLQRAQHSMRAMQQLHKLLVVFDMASRERGPANGVLGDNMPPDQPSKPC